MRKDFSFPKESSEVMKGIAILLMLFHHFFGFPNWYVEGISYIGLPLRFNTAEYVLGQFGHICVGIFAFLTGYGMFFSYKSGTGYKKVFKTILKFLICYWLILFGIAIPLHYFFGYTTITPMLIFKNMFAYDTTLVPFAWYVRFYIGVMLTLPLINKIMPNKALCGILLCLIIPSFLNFCLGKVPGINIYIIEGVSYLMEYFLWLPCVLMGLCCGKYNLFEKIDKGLKKLKWVEHIVCVGLLLAILYLRAYKEDTIGVIFSFDSFYVPIFVYICTKYMESVPKFIKKSVVLLGKHSMNIWFLHSMFFFKTSALMKYAFFPKVSVLIILWVIVLCLPLSMMLNAVSGVLMPVKKEKARVNIEKEERELVLKQ